MIATHITHEHAYQQLKPSRSLRPNLEGFEADGLAGDTRFVFLSLNEYLNHGRLDDEND
jgi:hypothetical protein